MVIRATWLILLTISIAVRCFAAAPVLYRQPALQSPVTGEPDDLLLLAGYGFAGTDTVVYRALRDTQMKVVPPLMVPQGSTDVAGTASIVSTKNVPYALTVRLPAVLIANQSYALWVRTEHGEWSLPVMINDARPLWMTPSFAYATTMPAFLPRELKIIGRNLQPIEGYTTRVKMLGPQQFELPGLSVPHDPTTLNHYVLRVALPPHLKPGEYRILVSRDGISWVPLSGQAFAVVRDPATVEEFDVSDSKFGGCRPDDGADDTRCILHAISAAKNAGGGIVRFGRGTWDLIDSSQAGQRPAEGIVIAEAVHLEGAGSGMTILQRHMRWNDRASTPALTLLSHTSIDGFTFRDLQTYKPGDHSAPFLQIGMSDERFSAASDVELRAAVVDDVTISRNVFDKPFVAVGSGGLPMSRLFITYNVFGAYLSSLELAGDRFFMGRPFRIDDSIVDHNRFMPSSLLDLAQKTGTIASELGAGHRLDFSGNTADGSSTEFLYSPMDAKGWRAAFFWNMNNNVEEMLVSRNTATCTGDKIGDGEAIAFDDNANTFALSGWTGVVAADATSVAISAGLAPRQNDREVPAESYYIGHWVQIANGPGLGEARQIFAYSTDAVSHLTTFKVSPAWDVQPVAGQTQIVIGREFWQVYTLANRIDNRQPLCQKSNRSRKAGGVITLWAQSIDSVIEANEQYDTDGIFVQQSYELPEHACADCTMSGFFHSFLEIRGNLVDGEYDWGTDCSASGIAMGIAAAPWRDQPPPTVGFGNLISHNRIRHADGQQGGGISQVNSWYPGPAPYRWPLSDNLLIFKNEISDIDGSRSLPICTSSRPRTGIAFPDTGTAWFTVLYGNSCKNVARPLGPGAIEMTAVCPSNAPDSCECPK
jgi:hypothetical protein